MPQITNVSRPSPAFKAGIAAGDNLISIDGHTISDVLDYQFYGYDAKINVKVSRGGDILSFDIKKGEGQPLGLDFETYLMDEQKGCSNHCLFCFIDQNPKGMRETIYFKDDDARLSFLVGNYISMTNLSDSDAQRIINMRFSPLNISVHTTNPALRSKMLGNKEGGGSLRHLQAFASAGLSLKTQIVLCPGLNDGEELLKTLTDLSKLYPAVLDIAVVPVGLSKHRQGLSKLEAMDRDSARGALDIIEAVRKENTDKHGCPLVYPADEIFIKAQLEIPAPEYYGGFEQLENGVGLMALFEEQVLEELEYCDNPPLDSITIITGVDAAPFMEKMLDYCRSKWHNFKGDVYPILNDFYGTSVSVAGLVTGGDIIAQLKEKPLNSRLLIPSCMLRHKENVFLDDTTIEQVEVALGRPVTLCEIDGCQFVQTISQPT